MRQSKRVNVSILVFVLLLSICILPLSASARQKVQIRGVVVDAVTGEPLVNANVIVVGTDKGAAAGGDGQFLITNLAPGQITLKVKMVGYEPAQKIVQAQAGKPVFVRFELKEGFFQTEQIVVTATRTEKLLQDVPVVTELVTDEEIEEKGADDLAEALQDRPGILIESNSSGGKILRMNGIDNKRILLLVDGNPIAGKIQDRVELNLVDTDKIDHIEIVKGPGSALYGSEAMGGVINIITRGVTEKFQVKANAKTGSYDLYSGNLSLSGKTGGVGYLVAVDHNQEGVDKIGSEIDVKNFHSDGMNARLETENHVGKFQASGEYKETEQNAELMGYGGAQVTKTSVKHWNTYLNWQKSLADNAVIKAKGYTSNNFRTYQSAIKNSTRPASIDTITENITGMRSDVYMTLNKALHLDMGYDFSNNTYESDRIGQKISRKEHGVFAQAEFGPIRNFTLMLGGRYDKITDLPGHFSPRISAMYQIAPDLKFRAAWGGGFRAPSFVEMYSDFMMPIPGHPIFLKGNAELKPEKSTGSNLGVEYFWNYKVLINVTAYRNLFEDMISDYWKQYGSLLSYRNIESATFTGAELQSKFYLLKNFTTTFSYNYTNIKHSEDKDVSLGISPHTFTLRLNYKMFKNRINLSVRDQFFSSVAVSQYVQQASGNINAETTTRKAYSLLDATITYKFSKLLSIRVGATNLADYTNSTFGPWYGRRFFVALQTQL